MGCCGVMLVGGTLKLAAQLVIPRDVNLVDISGFGRLPNPFQ